MVVQKGEKGALEAREFLDARNPPRAFKRARF
jgi:hypothetical protein